jgi:hypothetical protein
MNGVCRVLDRSAEDTPVFRRKANGRDRQTPKSAAKRRKTEGEVGFLQRGALFKEPVEADSRHPNEISRRKYGIHWQAQQAPRALK